MSSSDHTVKFSHNFTKLRGQKSGFLCWVDIYHVGNDMPKETKEYDTDGKYEFEPDTDYLQLVFLGDKDIPFTTYRDDTWKNRNKYIGHIGEVFEFEIVKRT